jgi:hypothetical protein
MTSIKSNLDCLDYLSGVDATHLLGAYDRAVERVREAAAALDDMRTDERQREYELATEALALMKRDPHAWGAAA